MTFLSLLLTAAGGLVCTACVGGLAFLLSWRDLAVNPQERARRLCRTVLPGATALLGLLLWTMFQVMLLWAHGASPALAEAP